MKKILYILLSCCLFLSCEAEKTYPSDCPGNENVARCDENKMELCMANGQWETSLDCDELKPFGEWICIQNSKGIRCVEKKFFM